LTIAAAESKGKHNDNDYGDTVSVAFLFATLTQTWYRGIELMLAQGGEA
jgi:hypothetical protein